MRRLSLEAKTAEEFFAGLPKYSSPEPVGSPSAWNLLPVQLAAAAVAGVALGALIGFTIGGEAVQLLVVLAPAIWFGAWLLAIVGRLLTS